MPGTVKYVDFHVLSLEGSKGLTILEVADMIEVIMEDATCLYILVLEWQELCYSMFLANFQGIV